MGATGFEQAISGSLLLAGLSPEHQGRIVARGRGTTAAAGELLLDVRDDAAALVLRGVSLARRPATARRS